MRYLKRLFFLSVYLFILSGCNNGSGNNQQASSSIKMPTNSKLANYFSVRNHTGKKIARVTVVTGNNVIYTKSMSCSKICKITIDESKIKSNLTFNFFSQNGTPIASYFWPHGTIRKMAIGKVNNKSLTVNALPICDPAADSTTFGVFNIFSGAFPPPISIGLGFLLNVGKGVMQDSCDASQGNTQDMVSELSHRVDLLDSEMGKADYNIIDIAQDYRHG